jgi:hypothetical protein
MEEGAKGENLQANFWPIHPLTVLADAYRAAGEISLATETVSRALKLSNKREERRFEVWAGSSEALPFSHRILEFFL